jgi:predicted DNA-binding transcriptional regulator AlpA
MRDTVVRSHNNFHNEPHVDKSKRRPHVYARELPADDDAFARLETILTVYPIGKSTWWKGVADGRFPAGIKLGPRLTVWRVGAIRKLLSEAR